MSEREKKKRGMRFEAVGISCIWNSCTHRLHHEARATTRHAALSVLSHGACTRTIRYQRSAVAGRLLCRQNEPTHFRATTMSTATTADEARARKYPAARYRSPHRRFPAFRVVPSSVCPPDNGGCSLSNVSPNTPLRSADRFATQKEHRI